LPRRRKKGKSNRALVALLAVVAVLAVAFAVLHERQQARRPPAPAAPEKAPSPGARPHPRRPHQPPPETPPEAPSAAPEELPPGGGARVGLVIDDLGRSVGDLDRLARLGVPLTYSVLPFESHTREVVAKLVSRRAEFICHLPMEPDNGKNPGPGALSEAMSHEEMAAATRRALAAVPGAVGVNNHMGSQLSTEVGAMRAVLGVVAERGLFFLDSRTSSASVAYDTALSLGVPAAKRQVFLDDERTPAAIGEQFRRLLSLAREQGAAIAIGHPYPETFAALTAEIPRARAAGYEFVPVSYLLDNPGAPPSR
jgi:uncharacterized protein